MRCSKVLGGIRTIDTFLVETDANSLVEKPDKRCEKDCFWIFFRAARDASFELLWYCDLFRFTRLFYGSKIFGGSI